MRLSALVLCAVFGCTGNIGNTGDGGPGGSGGGASGGGSGGATGGSGGGATGGSGGGATGGSGGSTGNGRTSLVWVWYDFPGSLSAVAAHASSFTHVAPTLYQVNYSYTSGVAQFTSTTNTDNFDGLTGAQIAQQVHAAGMKCTPLIFGGAGNAGTDLGLQHILDDTPAGAQTSFITSMVNEAVAKGYDGYNVDWEVDTNTTNYAGYGTKLLSFLTAFKAALHAHGMTLSIDLGTWFLKQSFCSGGDGVADLTAIGATVDQVIVMDYMSSLGTASSSCPGSLPNPQACSSDFVPALNLMCVYVTPAAAINIGFNANATTGNNPIAGESVSTVLAYGLKNVAIWPDWNSNGAGGAYLFMDSTANVPAGSSWYQLLANFLAAP